ncbi:MAG TPA: hypothetical protein VL326_19620 [Kofleriaceae bacterium]|nr:hypothetical protein [Kofleriaceae bacterium]
MSTSLPTAVQKLLETQIDTFEKLELVVHLAEAPRSARSIDAVSRDLNVGREEVRRTAAELPSLVDLTFGSELRLLPLTSSDHAAVLELAMLYREDRFAVVTAMGKIALERIRGLATRVFVDAFAIGRPVRKKPDEDP